MTCDSKRNDLIHVNLAIVSTNALYSTSIEDLETIPCFLLDHMIGLSLIKTIISDMDLLSSTEDA